MICFVYFFQIILISQESFTVPFFLKYYLLKCCFVFIFLIIIFCLILFFNIIIFQLSYFYDTDSYPKFLGQTLQPDPIKLSSGKFIIIICIINIILNQTLQPDLKLSNLALQIDPTFFCLSFFSYCFIQKEINSKC